jgi:hypothetical protein
MVTHRHLPTGAGGREWGTLFQCFGAPLAYLVCQPVQSYFRCRHWPHADGQSGRTRRGSDRCLRSLMSWPQALSTALLPVVRVDALHPADRRVQSLSQRC